MGLLPSFAAMASASLILFMGGAYCLKIARGEAHPPIATWIIFEIGVIMSLVTYLSAPSHDLVRNVANTTDCLAVTFILGTLIVKNRKEGIRFHPNEWICLAISAATFIAWLEVHMPLVGVGGFQVVMTVAYYPTYRRLWTWKRPGTPEPPSIWTAEMAAAILGIYVAASGHDLLATLYPIRAMMMCSTVLVFIWILKRKQRPMIALS